MTRAVILFIIFFSKFSYSQTKEMVETFSKGNFDQTIELGKKILETDSLDFDANLMIVKAYNEKADFANACIYLRKCKSLVKYDWQKSWTFIEAVITDFGLGNADEARKSFFEAKQINGTKNSERKLKEIGYILGFDEFYNNWKIRESENIIFHFENTVSDEEIERIVVTRQKAFDQINSFFYSNMLKKIDFFVWKHEENYNPYLNTSLGFSLPNLTISHSRINQTPGHEIAHNISFWKNKENVQTKFINEGIGVCFDQQKNDKLKIAKEVYKKDPINIIEIWKKQTKLNDAILYPISGAFVQYLIDYDKKKFLNLVENQTYENAEKIYAQKIDKLIDEFIKKLKE